MFSSVWYIYIEKWKTSRCQSNLQPNPKDGFQARPPKLVKLTLTKKAAVQDCSPQSLPFSESTCPFTPCRSHLHPSLLCSWLQHFGRSPSPLSGPYLILCLARALSSSLLCQWLWSPDASPGFYFSLSSFYKWAELSCWSDFDWWRKCCQSSRQRPPDTLFTLYQKIKRIKRPIQLYAADTGCQDFTVRRLISGLLNSDV